MECSYDRSIYLFLLAGEDADLTKGLRGGKSGSRAASTTRDGAQPAFRQKVRPQPT